MKKAVTLCLEKQGVGLVVHVGGGLGVPGSVENKVPTPVKAGHFASVRHYLSTSKYLVNGY